VTAPFVPTESDFVAAAVVVVADTAAIVQIAFVVAIFETLGIVFVALLVVETVSAALAVAAIVGTAQRSCPDLPSPEEPMLGISETEGVHILWLQT